MSTKELVSRNGQPAPLSISAQLAKALSPSAIAYINERGTEVGSLCAVEMKLQQKATKLREQLNDTPEAQQLRKVQEKLRQVKAKRSETVTKIAGVIEKEIGSKADAAIDALFGDEPKLLKGR